MTNQRRPASMLLYLALIFMIGILLAMAAAHPASGAPSRLDCRNVALTAPSQGALLSGTVEITGQAQVSNFQFYKVEYAPAARDQWVLIGTDVVRRPVPDGLLVAWQTGNVSEGEYRLRLRVVDVTGNYCEASIASVTIARAQPTETIPEPTETAVLTAVPPLPTVTVALKPTLEVGPIVSQPGPIPTRSLPIDLPDVDTTGLVAFFASGVLIMVALLLSVGLVMFVRRWR